MDAGKQGSSSNPPPLPVTAAGQPVPLIHRYLDPSTSLAEILFGVIMTLTFTLSAGLIIEDEGRAGARELLIAVIGCNIAWGVIDGALFLVGQLFDRGRLRRLGRAIVQASDPAAARSAGRAGAGAAGRRPAERARSRRALRACRRERPAQNGAPERDHARRLARRGRELRPGHDQLHSGGDSVHADRRRAPGFARVERNPRRAALLHRLLVGALHGRQALAWPAWPFWSSASALVAAAIALGG